MAPRREGMRQQAPYPVASLSKVKTDLFGNVAAALQEVSERANGSLLAGMYLLNRVHAPTKVGKEGGPARKRWVTRGGPALERQSLQRHMPKYKREGFASWYGPRFHGQATASLEEYDMEQMTAAHRTLPFGTMLKVTNKENGRSCVVRVNDRGPYPGVAGPDHYSNDNRVIDLSRAAARSLDMLGCGVAPISIQELPHDGTGSGLRIPMPGSRSWMQLRV